MAKTATTDEFQKNVQALKNSIKRSTSTQFSGLMLRVGKKHFHLPFQYSVLEGENFVYVSLNKLDNGVFRLSGTNLEPVTKENLEQASKELKALTATSGSKVKKALDPEIQKAQDELLKLMNRMPKGFKIVNDPKTNMPKVVKMRVKKPDA